MIRCDVCVMPSTRPDVPFTDGTCQACRNFENRPYIDWGTRKQMLVDLLDRHHGECIVPSSGGKDSTAQVLKLQAMGAHVTVVTARTCYLTDIGRKNIDNLARYAKTIEVVPNMTVRAKLNRHAHVKLREISIPFFHPLHSLLARDPAGPDVHAELGGAAPVAIFAVHHKIVNAGLGVVQVLPWPPVGVARVLELHAGGDRQLGVLVAVP